MLLKLFFLFLLSDDILPGYNKESLFPSRPLILLGFHQVHQYHFSHALPWGWLLKHQGILKWLFLGQLEGAPWGYIWRCYSSKTGKINNKLWDKQKVIGFMQMLAVTCNQSCDLSLVRQLNMGHGLYPKPTGTLIELHLWFALGIAALFNMNFTFGFLSP